MLAATALSIDPMVCRNLAPNVTPSAQRRWTVVAVAGFLVLAAVLTLIASTLMLTVLNLTYNLLAQVVPGWLAILFARRVRTSAVAARMVIGVLTAVTLYATGVTAAGSIPIWCPWASTCSWCSGGAGSLPAPTASRPPAAAHRSAPPPPRNRHGNPPNGHCPYRTADTGVSAVRVRMFAFWRHLGHREGPRRTKSRISRNIRYPVPSAVSRTREWR